MKPEIFTYLDYRNFLKDAFAAFKIDSPRLSFRSFGKKAGFTSPNFLQQVMQGKRNLSSTNLVGVAKAFKLNKQETEFFQNLVAYNQAKSLDEKNLFFQRIVRTSRYSASQNLEKSQYDFFSHWYVPVVRELLTHPEFNGLDAWIADRIFPRITATQVSGARALLERLGLIRQDPANGKWIPTSSVVTTDSEVADLAVGNYHMAALKLAQDAIRSFPQQDRDIRSVTLGIPTSAYGELKARMENMWQEVLAFAAQFQEAETVYLVNMQLFPLVRERKNSHVS